MKYLTEFMLYVCLILTIVGGLVFGFDREMARREYERYNTTQKESITGCIFESNCAYYNDLLDKEHD